MAHYAYFYHIKTFSFLIQTFNLLTLMTERRQIYRCQVCGNIVEVVHPAGGTLSCCGQPMQLLAENSQDAAVEKHVPVVENIDGGYRVTVGSVEHPMLDNHHIEWIELITADGTLRKYLKPGEKPVAEFFTKAEVIAAREYCNLHGLWKK